MYPQGPETSWGFLHIILRNKHIRILVLPANEKFSNE
uniref:Uncharacterized protein n=1 Tax=Anguilla anguilla TaxID=7936 RepID=A0A0E9VZM7_ANGAN